MTDELADFWVHTVTVETLLAETTFGKQYAPESDPIPGFLSDKRKLIRTAAGDSAVSESTFTANRQYAGLFTAGSIVHLPTRVATVMKTADNSSGPLELPDHIEVNLN